MEKIKISCIYLAAQAVHDGKKMHYLIKIGKSSDYANRLQSYISHNPYIKMIEIMPVENNELNALERQLHTVLHSKYLNTPGTAEWFECSKKEYKKILKQGFDYIVK